MGDGRFSSRLPLSTMPALLRRRPMQPQFFEPRILAIDEMLLNTKK
jgi:hypothetical protein